MEQKFSDILEKDEQILKIFKPNKCKYWTSTWLAIIFSSIWVYMFLTISIPIEGEEFNAGLFWMIFGIISAVFVLLILLTCFFAKLSYNNRFYAYSNKRIIIRSGIIGIDFKSLEFKSLTATAVNVSVIDKIIRKNTGSIRFGSPSSPMGGMTSSNGGYINPYAFMHIEKPYDTLKEIKEYINSQDK